MKRFILLIVIFSFTLLSCSNLKRTGKSYYSSDISTYTGPFPVVGIAVSNEKFLSNPVSLDREVDYEQIREIVWLALDRDISPRSLTKIVKKNHWVVIKPNLVTNPKRGDFNADDVMHWGLATDLRVVKAIAEYLIEKVGPKRITIAEGGGWPKAGGKYSPKTTKDGWNTKWEKFGNISYEEMAKQINRKQKTTLVDLQDLNEDEGVYVKIPDPFNSGIGSYQDVPPGNPEGSSKTEWTKRRGYYISKTVMDCDILISAPVLKTHSSAGVTLSMKNLMGCVNALSYGTSIGKSMVHQGTQLGLIRGVVDLFCAIQPDYTVVEGFWSTVQQHEGQNGVNTIHNVVIASGDVVAADAISMIVMGYNPLDYDMLRMVHAKGYGQWHPDSIKVIGPPVLSVQKNYGKAKETYNARGIRKWLILGPLSSPLDKPAALNPRKGNRMAGAEWKLIDGDAIIDGTVQVRNPALFKTQKCLMYPIPGSKNAPVGSHYYLAVKINSPFKNLCGNLLVGLEGADVNAYFNGSALKFNKDPMPYDPTPMPFIKFKLGENVLVLEIIKKENGDIRLAANTCDLDGDRLLRIRYDPPGE